MLTRLLLPLMAAACAACASTDPGAAPDLASTRLSHDVYFVLSDPSAANQDALVAACERLREIPGVVHLTVGRRDESQTRDVNRTDYHVGLHVEFTGADAYDGYGPHPVHQALLEEFGPSFERVEVFDTQVEPR
jgi:hypothetical protein